MNANSPDPIGEPVASLASVPATHETVLWPERYHMLDGWRGLAAVVVVGFHAFGWPFGHEAVMLFFIISGYCITAAASSASRRKLGFRQFMWRRMKRIYPPYLFAIGYFVLTRIAASHFGRGDRLSQFSLLDWVQNLTLTQWVTLLFHPADSPANNPSNMIAVFWSLGYEEQFYLVIAGLIALSFISRRAVAAVAIVLAVGGLALNVISPHRVFGFFLEYWFHFATGGALFFRLCRIKSKGIRTAFDELLLLLLVAGVARTALGLDRGALRPLGMEWSVIAGFSLALLALRRFDDAYRRAAIGRALSALGLISFSLYLVHQCSLMFAFAVANRLWRYGGPVPFGEFHAVNGSIQLAIHLAIATIFWYCCERPFLNRTLTPDRPSQVG